MKWFAVCCIFVCISCSSKEEKDYKKKVVAERAAKNQQFALDDAPLTDSLKEHFTGLKYFPIDLKYKVTATMEAFPRPQTVVLQQGDTSTRMVRFAKTRFNIEGKGFELTVFKPELDPASLDEDYLFIPFFDKTNGSQTYSGGRYLYPAIEGGANLTLDFNEATNPYCAYNHKYNCVVPPAENTLDVEIKAGEKSYE